MTAEHKGFHKAGITTATYANQPSEAFADAHALNMGVEVYAFKRGVKELLEPLAKKNKVIPVQITADAIARWQGMYPDAKVSRIHGPFAYDMKDADARLIYSWRNSPQPATIRHMLWPYVFGLGEDMHAFEVAKRVQENQKQEVGLSLHANIWEGLARDDKMEEIKKSGLLLYVESAGRDGSTLLSPSQLSNPKVVVGMVEEYGLDGLVIGAENGLKDGVDIAKSLRKPEVQEHTVAMHIDSITGKSLEVIKTVALTNFSHPVEVTLDLRPRQIKNMSARERQDQIRVMTYDAWFPFERNVT